MCCFLPGLANVNCQLAKPITPCQSRNWCGAKMMGYGFLTAVAITITLIAFYKGMDSVSKAVHTSGLNSFGHGCGACGFFLVTGGGAAGIVFCFQRAKQHFQHLPAGSSSMHSHTVTTIHGTTTTSSSSASSSHHMPSGTGHRLGNS